MLGDFDYEYGDEGVGTLSKNVDIDGFLVCSKCSERLDSNETHDCIQCVHCGEYDLCICENAAQRFGIPYEEWIFDE